MNLPLLRILISTSVKWESWSRLVIRELPAMIFFYLFPGRVYPVASMPLFIWQPHWYLRFGSRTPPPTYWGFRVNGWVSGKRSKGRRGNIAAESLLFKCLEPTHRSGNLPLCNFLSCCFSVVIIFLTRQMFEFCFVLFFVCSFLFLGMGGVGQLLKRGKEKPMNIFFTNRAASKDTKHRFPYKGCNSVPYLQVHHLHFRLWQRSSTSLQVLLYSIIVTSSSLHCYYKSL